MTLRIMLILGILAWLLVANSLLAADPHEDTLAATFRIFDSGHSGTSFLVVPKVVDPANPRRVVLVTAAHVFQEMTGKTCELLLRSEAEDHSHIRHPFVVEIRDGDIPNWTRHPELDIAAMLINLPEGVLARPFQFDQIAEESRLTDRTIRVGREAWIPCFPSTLEANAAGWPI